jgi:ZIP family zinc transporter
MDTNTIIGVLLPFVGTTLGAAMVLVLRRKIGNGLQKLLLGFASGVMIAESVWSLLRQNRRGGVANRLSA